jgi:multicomponent Na+:H+ antiporter subunit E
MNWFFTHLLFTLLWVALLGSYDLPTLLSGFVIGFGLFRMTLDAPTAAYRKRVLVIGRFILFYIKEILTSNLRIARDVMRTKPAIQPGIVAVDIRALNTRSAVFVANLITMTPGTLALDLSADGHFLYVHCLYLQDPEAVRQSLEKDFIAAVAAFNQEL